MVMKIKFRRGDVGDIIDLGESIPKEQTIDIPMSQIEVPKPIPVSNREDEDYKSDVQKMVSFKGIIRPLTVSVKNRGGGIYKMRIINIYVKPNAPNKKGVLKEYTRYYENKSYPVDKKAIIKGSNAEGYYPEKANWSKKRAEGASPHSIIKHNKPLETSIPPVSENTTIGEDVIQLRKKKRNMILKRLVGKKTNIKSKIKHKPSKRCICKRKK